MNGELQEALEQIAEIRHQMARTEVFRGYRARSVTFSGLMALSAGVAQALWIPQPVDQLSAYLTLWVGAAVLSAAVAGVSMLERVQRAHPRWSREVTRLALEQFIPSMIAGGLVTAVLVVTAPDLVWLLPGIWQILFGLGIFASSHLLPWPIRGVAAWYLITGVTCLVMARGPLALSPWAMSIPFGAGQFLAAAILYWTLEREVEIQP